MTGARSLTKNSQKGAPRSAGSFHPSWRCSPSRLSVSNGRGPPASLAHREKEARRPVRTERGNARGPTC
eukprot:scaffold123256_cov32-Tisochrysis_lutea.AAC.4